MIPLLVILAVFLLLAFILALRVRIVATVREGVTLSAHVLFLSFRIHPRKRKRVRWSKRATARAKRKERRKAQKAAKKAAKKAKKRAAQQHTHAVSPSTLRNKLRLLGVLLATLVRHTDKHLTLHTVRLRIRVGAEDAAKTAVLYGAVAQSVAYLLDLTEHVTRLRSCRDEVSVTPDFLSERTTADVKLVFSIRILGLLKTGLALALAFLKEKHRQKRARQAAQKKVNSNGQAIPVGKE